MEKEKLKYLKKIIKYLLDKISGKVIFQSFWKRLHNVSLVGMNFGNLDIHIDGEKEILKCLSQKPNKPVIFDVGANIGEYSLEVISIFGKNVRLYCFEPSKKAFNSLKENLSGYPNIKLYNFGLGQKNEITTLFYSRQGSGLASIFKRRLNHFNIQMEHREKIELRGLDDFCKENLINHIHFLKLDTEGNELQILQGARELINSNSIDFIQFEFGGANIDSRTFFQDFFYLLNPNYRIHRILKNGLVPIDNYEEKQEIFDAINYLAVSRKL